ncbi:sigma 54-interacting transcriptional regulator, partial [Novosphingobium sp.]|uniref:sigma 54-interacting transcriptional regulator n=1 Tax=Novosphingobium sp. TaxID=1874826 RepID=UPI00286E048E
MPGMDISSAALGLHAPLLHRATAVLGMSPVTGSGEALSVGDIEEARSVPSGRAAITLARTSHPSLTRREGNGRHVLAYSDPVSEASLAAFLAAATPEGQPIALDPESLSILALAERLAASEIPVLINGPTGTGKEVLSRFIHLRSPRADAPFIAINCAAMPETMLEAMLFGHQKGSFTGANAAGEGFFRAAHGGTLLLDEIAEMPLALQAKLLRVLQEGEVVPLGATRPVKADVRVIACANRDLPAEVDEGRFRADLYYRLNVFPLELAALCERPADVAPLAFAMVLRHVPAGRPVPWIGEAALAILEAHAWPGNVRELENVMRRALLLAGDAPEIGMQHIVFDRAVRTTGETAAAEPPPGMTTIPGGKLSNIVQLSETRAILAALDSCG